MFLEHLSPTVSLTQSACQKAIKQMIDTLGNPSRILIVPPDITRLHSHAGILTQMLYAQCKEKIRAIIPALGTHSPMTRDELSTMFGSIPHDLFLEHRWRTDCVKIGEIPASFVRTVSGGTADFPVPLEINRIVVEGNFDAIISLGQIVPHEVAGMSGYTKNLVVGLGGAATIHATHFVGALAGIENALGKSDAPVRQILNEAARRIPFCAPVFHILTVMKNENGANNLKGLFIGNTDECYNKASALARQENITFVDKPISKAVVSLDPNMYKSTWLGNKSIYRTRMAIADGGELLVLAPGVSTFGEDPAINSLIKKYGYCGTANALSAVANDCVMRENLSAAAHLMHGSSEGRFSITYATGFLSKQDIEGVGYSWKPIDTMLTRYNPAVLRDGFNTLDDGEEIFFVSSPGAGLWVSKAFR